jgi:hypothetical protein
MFIAWGHDDKHNEGEKIGFILSMLGLVECFFSLSENSSNK